MGAVQMANLPGNLESEGKDRIRSLSMYYSLPICSGWLTRDGRPGSAGSTRSTFNLWTGRLPIIGDGLMRQDRSTEGRGQSAGRITVAGGTPLASIRMFPGCTPTP